MNLKREIISIGADNYKILRGGDSVMGTVLFLHGWNSKSERYESSFSHLPENFAQIIIPDLPGFGESPKPNGVWGIDEYSEWVFRLIATLGIEKIIIAGHSFGGQLAINIASENDSKIIGAIFYASARVRKHSSAKKKIFRSLAKMGSVVFSFPGLSVFSQLAKKVIYKMAGSADYLNSNEMREIMAKVVEQNMEENITKIDIPVGIIWGNKDKATPVSDAYYLERNIKNSNLRIIDGAGHKFHMDAPEQFAHEFSEQVSFILNK